MIIDSLTLERINMFVESYILGFANQDVSIMTTIDTINDTVNEIKSLLSNSTELSRSIV